ncbi:MAG: mobilization protein [Pseudomonadota bacterium]|jgi:septal ring factor EnvC (AmiA/AmiB activator)|nr:mobilization protein [Pseudomonadota bacterium]
MPKLDEQIDALETRLKQLKAQQQRIDARRRSIEVRRTRKDETRRKILVGAIVLAKVQAGEIDEKRFRQWVDEALSRPEDRALFELP